MLKNEDADYNLSICAQPAYADMTKIQRQIGGAEKRQPDEYACKICIQLSYYFMRQRRLFLIATFKSISPVILVFGKGECKHSL